MKQLLKIRTLTTLLFLLATSWTSVYANEYEEVTYEELLNELSAQKNTVQRSLYSPFDSIMIHTGIGITMAANQIRVDNQDIYRNQNGFQLSMGIDLFSPYWSAEGSIRNFGTSRTSTESRSIREFDLKVVNRNILDAKFGYRLGMGIGHRTSKYSDSRKGIYLNENTPTTVFFGGVDNYINKNLSLGFEAGLRSAMVGSTSEKNSFDITLRLDTYY